MDQYLNAKEIISGVHWVGVKDAERRIFDALIKLPQGTSYNSYLIKGSTGTAVIDTVLRDFSTEWSGKLSSLVPIADIDYLIMNHAEPDHASSIPYFLSVNTKAKIYMTKAGVALAQKFYQVPTERIVVIKDGDEINLGGKTLRFIEATMLHWPETMFTYLVEDAILFPCDFFGAHTSLGLYATEVSDIIDQAKKYFAEIMMPFRPFAQKAMDKLAKLELKIIAPSHGPIYQETAELLKNYQSWISGVRQNKAVISYVSMWGDTQTMAQGLAEELKAQGIQVSIYDLASSDIGEVARDLVDAKAWVLGAPAVLNQAHPLASYAINVIDILKPKVPYTAIIGSYGWAKAVETQLAVLLKPLEAEMVGAVEIKGPANQAEQTAVKDLADAIAQRIKS